MQISDNPLELALSSRRHGPAHSPATGSRGHVWSASEGSRIQTLKQVVYVQSYTSTDSNSSRIRKKEEKSDRRVN